MKNTLNFTLGLLLISLISFAQSDKQKIKLDNSFDNIIMTWNKNTPEQEMQDDIKALKEYGVTINYANVKRNDKKEITGIDVTFEDAEGNKGSLSYNQVKPITTIKFYKQGDTVGFGEPTNAFDDMAMFNNLLDDDKVIYGLDYKINPPNDGSHFKSRTLIKRDDREPLVIEDGKVIEGGNDYSKEEIDEILKQIDEEIIGKEKFKSFKYKGNEDFSEQLENIQKQLDELKKRQQNANENDSKQSNEKTENVHKKTKKSLKTQKV
jgi:hypothetical protein